MKKLQFFSQNGIPTENQMVWRTSKGKLLMSLLKTLSFFLTTTMAKKNQSFTWRQNNTFENKFTKIRKKSASIWISSHISKQNLRSKITMKFNCKLLPNGEETLFFIGSEKYGTNLYKRHWTHRFKISFQSIKLLKTLLVNLLLHFSEGSSLLLKGRRITAFWKNWLWGHLTWSLPIQNHGAKSIKKYFSHWFGNRKANRTS